MQFKKQSEKIYDVSYHKSLFRHIKPSFVLPGLSTLWEGRLVQPRFLYLLDGDQVIVRVTARSPHPFPDDRRFVESETSADVLSMMRSLTGGAPTGHLPDRRLRVLPVDTHNVQHEFSAMIAESFSVNARVWGIALSFRKDEAGRDNDTEMAVSKRHLALQGILDMWLTDNDVENAFGLAISHCPQKLKGVARFIRHSWTYEDGVGVVERTLQYKDGNHPTILHTENIGQDYNMDVPRTISSVGEKGSMDVRLNIVLGGILPLGTMIVPYGKNRAQSLGALTRWSRETSMTILERDYLSKTFYVFRFWDRSHGAFSADSIQNVARYIRPDDSLETICIPVWDYKAARGALTEHARATDIVFYDAKTGLGILLLRDCTIETAKAVVAKKLTQSGLSIGSPDTLAHFLKRSSGVVKAI